MKAPDLTEADTALSEIVEDELFALEFEALREMERVRKELEDCDDLDA